MDGKKNNLHLHKIHLYSYNPVTTAKLVLQIKLPGGL